MRDELLSLKKEKNTNLTFKANLGNVEAQCYPYKSITFYSLEWEAISFCSWILRSTVLMSTNFKKKLESLTETLSCDYR